MPKLQFDVLSFAKAASAAPDETIVRAGWSKFQRADHILVVRTGFNHHGIYCGDGTVIHWTKPKGAPPRIDRTPVSEFLDGKTIHAVRLAQRATTSAAQERVLARATQEIGRQGYSLFDDNCEHFAAACYGQRHSAQVRAAKDFANQATAVELARYVATGKRQNLLGGVLGIAIAFGERWLTRRPHVR